jgi:uncharacterized protein YcbK (DUF882 family)
MTVLRPPMSLLRRFATVALVLAVCSVGLRSKIKAEDIPTGITTKRVTPPAEQYRLRMYHTHTGENIDVVYKVGAEFVPSGLDKLNHFLRDHRTDDVSEYDPKEFDLLHRILVKLHKPNAVIRIICGYRTPESNNFLRTRAAETGVAEHSQHMLAKAIDIQIPGVSTRRLRDAALSQEMGGVGYYPRSQFVHVDVGPVRQWSYGAVARTTRRHRRTRRG